MPQLEELQYYFRGLWLLLLGRLEGFGWLDLSERGFWRSWWAFVFCLPPMALSWAGERMYYLSLMPAGVSAGPNLIAKMAISDISVWIASYLALAFVMTISGYAERIGPMIIAINWLTVPMQWLSIFPSLVLVFAPGDLELYVSAVFPWLLVFAAAHFMVIRQIVHRKSLPATAFLLALIVSTLWSASVINDALGIGLL
jgi:hypothetical protein